MRKQRIIKAMCALLVACISFAPQIAKKANAQTVFFGPVVSQTRTASINIASAGQNTVKITQQPKSVTVASGQNAVVKFTATGDGLTYKWYFKNKGQSSFTYTSTFAGNSYTAPMDATRNGRQVYCVVADKYGNKAQTNTVTLSMKNTVKITSQPTGVTVSNGAAATVKVGATGDGLTYKWYYKNKGASSFVLTTAFTGNTYSTVMNTDRNGRQLYCVVTDKYGNKAQTNTVTISMKSTVKITQQPQSVTVASGQNAVVKFTATGDGLTYKWYYKNKGQSSFTYTSTFAGNSYTAPMDATRSGRQVYCVVTDKYGNKAQTNTVTLSMKNTVKITSQPTGVTVSNGAAATVKVGATGDGLTYKWYYKNKGASSFVLTTAFTGNTYSTVMNTDRNGRQLYCVVTDKYGNKAQTNTVTISMKSTVKITQQPKSVTVEYGKPVSISLTATGDGLTYKWYFKNKRDYDFSYTSTFTGKAYTTVMDDARNGRQVYCVVSDKYGNSVKSSTVIMTKKDSFSDIAGNYVSFEVVDSRGVWQQWSEWALSVSADGKAAILLDSGAVVNYTVVSAGKTTYHYYYLLINEDEFVTVTYYLVSGTVELEFQNGSIARFM